MLSRASPTTFVAADPDSQSLAQNMRSVAAARAAAAAAAAAYHVPQPMSQALAASTVSSSRHAAMLGSLLAQIPTAESQQHHAAASSLLLGHMPGGLVPHPRKLTGAPLGSTGIVSMNELVASSGGAAAIADAKSAAGGRDDVPESLGGGSIISATPRNINGDGDGSWDALQRFNDQLAAAHESGRSRPSNGLKRPKSTKSTNPPTTVHEPKHSATSTEDDAELQLNKKTWSADEDQQLMQLLTVYTTKQWSQISTHLPGRSGKQCRERWRNHLDPTVVKGNWTEEEDRIIFEREKAVGRKWSEIAKALPGRSDNAVKNRFYSTQRKSERRKHKTQRLNASKKLEETAELAAIAIDGLLDGEDDGLVEGSFLKESISHEIMSDEAAARQALKAAMDSEAALPAVKLKAGEKRKRYHERQEAQKEQEQLQTKELGEAVTEASDDASKRELAAAGVLFGVIVPPPSDPTADGAAASMLMPPHNQPAAVELVRTQTTEQEQQAQLVAAYLLHATAFSRV